MPVVLIPGKGKVRFPDNMSAPEIDAVIRSGFKSAPAPKPAETMDPNETSLLRDVPAALISGVGQLLELPAQVYGLATGDFDTAYGKAMKTVSDFGQGLKSEGLKERERRASEKIAEAGKEGIGSEALTAAKEYLTDPRLLLGTVLESAPSLVGSLGAGTVAAKGTQVAAKLAAREASEAALRKAAVRGAVAFGATQQGADVGTDAYVTAMKEPEKVWEKNPDYKARVAAGEDPKTVKADMALDVARKTALMAGGVSAATAGLMPNTLEKMVLGGTAAEVAKKGLLRRTAAGFIPEAVQEAAEEGGGALATNVAMREVNPERSLLEGVGSAAVIGGLAGGLTGGFGGLMSPAIAAAPEQEAPPVPPEAPGPAGATTTYDINGEPTTVVAPGPVIVPPEGITPPEGAPPVETAPPAPATTGGITSILGDIGRTIVLNENDTDVPYTYHGITDDGSVLLGDENGNIFPEDPEVVAGTIRNPIPPEAGVAPEVTAPPEAGVGPEIAPPPPLIGEEPIDILPPEVTTPPEVGVEPEVTTPPVVTPPVVTQPEITQPEITQPEVTAPPEVTQPEITAPPEATVPEVTQPEVTTPPEAVEPFLAGVPEGGKVLNAETNKEADINSAAFTDAIRGKSAVGVMRHLSKNATTQPHRVLSNHLANMMEAMQGQGFKFNFAVADKGKKFASAILDAGASSLKRSSNLGVSRTIPTGIRGYGRSDIIVRGKGIKNPNASENTVIHEFVHGVTTGIIAQVERGFIPRSSRVGKAVTELEELVKKAQQVKKDILDGTAVGLSINDLAGLSHNAFANSKEMMSQGLTDWRMQKILKSIPYQKTNAFTKFVQIVGQMLGLAPKEYNGLRKFLEITEVLIPTDKKEQKKIAEQTMDWSKAPKPTGVPKGLQKKLDTIESVKPVTEGEEAIADLTKPDLTLYDMRSDAQEKNRGCG